MQSVPQQPTPFRQGVQDSRGHRPLVNPFPEKSESWWAYNRGYGAVLYLVLKDRRREH